MAYFLNQPWLKIIGQQCSENELLFAKVPKLELTSCIFCITIDLVFTFQSASVLVSACLIRPNRHGVYLFKKSSTIQSYNTYKLTFIHVLNNFYSLRHFSKGMTHIFIVVISADILRTSYFIKIIFDLLFFISFDRNLNGYKVRQMTNSRLLEIIQIHQKQHPKR